MRLLNIQPDTTLRQLSDRVGARNIGSFLSVNSLERQPQIGAQLLARQSQALSGVRVPTARRAMILNSTTQHTDVFERVALCSERDWRVLAATGSLLSTLVIPAAVSISTAADVLGNNIPVPSVIYDRAMRSLLETDRVNDQVFNEFSTRRDAQVVNVSEIEPIAQWFPIPWGMITLHSTLGDDHLDIPCYPEEFDDGITATYDTMPDLLFQYEPWQIYKGSGPRVNTYEFTMHRDMWSGNHHDGKCYELIQYCKANCYAEFRGAAVHTAIVTLYIASRVEIRGIMTACNVHWFGPIGQDGQHLACKMSITIVEVAEYPLNYARVRALRQV